VFKNGTRSRDESNDQGGARRQCCLGGAAGNIDACSDVAFTSNGTLGDRIKQIVG
jgi:hypothetical protein